MAEAEELQPINIEEVAKFYNMDINIFQALPAATQSSMIEAWKTATNWNGNQTTPDSGGTGGGAVPPQEEEIPLYLEIVDQPSKLVIGEETVINIDTNATELNMVSSNGDVVIVDKNLRSIHPISIGFSEIKIIASKAGYTDKEFKFIVTVVSSKPYADNGKPVSLSLYNKNTKRTVSIRTSNNESTEDVILYLPDRSGTILTEESLESLELAIKSPIITYPANGAAEYDGLFRCTPLQLGPLGKGELRAVRWQVAIDSNFEELIEDKTVSYGSIDGNKELLTVKFSLTDVVGHVRCRHITTDGQQSEWSNVIIVGFKLNPKWLQHATLATAPKYADEQAKHKGVFYGYIRPEHQNDDYDYRGCWWNMQGFDDHVGFNRVLIGDVFLDCPDVEECFYLPQNNQKTRTDTNCPGGNVIKDPSRLMAYTAVQAQRREDNIKRPYLDSFTEEHNTVFKVGMFPNKVSLNKSFKLSVETTGDYIITSSNSNVIRVNPNTQSLQALALGTARITVQHKTSWWCKCSAEITVVDEVLQPAASLSITGYDPVIVYDGSANGVMSLIVNNTHNYTSSSSNNAIATVNKNIITGVSNGVCTITFDIPYASGNEGVKLMVIVVVTGYPKKWREGVTYYPPTPRLFTDICRMGLGLGDANMDSLSIDSIKLGDLLDYVHPRLHNGAMWNTVFWNSGNVNATTKEARDGVSEYGTIGAAGRWDCDLAVFSYMGRLYCTYLKPLSNYLAWNDLAKADVAQGHLTKRIGENLWKIRLHKRKEFKDNLIGLTTGKFDSKDGYSFIMFKDTWLHDEIKHTHGRLTGSKANPPTLKITNLHSVIRRDTGTRVFTLETNAPNWNITTSDSSVINVNKNSKWLDPAKAGIANINIYTAETTLTNSGTYSHVSYTFQCEGSDKLVENHTLEVFNVPHHMTKGNNVQYSINSTSNDISITAITPGVIKIDKETRTITPIANGYTLLEFKTGNDKNLHPNVTIISIQVTGFAIENSLITNYKDPRSRTAAWRPVMEYIAEGDEPYRYVPIDIPTADWIGRFDPKEGEWFRYDKWSDTGYYGIINGNKFVSPERWKTDMKITDGTLTNTHTDYMKFYWHGRLEIIPIRSFTRNHIYRQSHAYEILHGVDMGGKHKKTYTVNGTEYLITNITGGRNTPLMANNRDWGNSGYSWFPEISWEYNYSKYSEWMELIARVDTGIESLGANTTSRWTNNSNWKQFNTGFQHGYNWDNIPSRELQLRYGDGNPNIWYCREISNRSTILYGGHYGTSFLYSRHGWSDGPDDAWGIRPLFVVPITKELWW